MFLRAGESSLENGGEWLKLWVGCGAGGDAMDPSMLHWLLVWLGSGGSCTGSAVGGTHTAGLVLEESFLLLVYIEKENQGSRTCLYSCFNSHGPNSQPEIQSPAVVRWGFVPAWASKSSNPSRHGAPILPHRNLYPRAFRS